MIHRGYPCVVDEPMKAPPGSTYVGEELLHASLVGNVHRVVFIIVVSDSTIASTTPKNVAMLVEEGFSEKSTDPLACSGDENDRSMTHLFVIHSPVPSRMLSVQACS